MTGWERRQLTFGTEEGKFHSHSYYDIPVLDEGGEQLLVHRMRFQGRHPAPEDKVEVGVVDTSKPGSWRALGESRAWSWQQGPMAQWVAGGPRLVFNDREGDDFVTRLIDSGRGESRTLPRPTYAVSPDGAFAFGLNMARLDRLRAGYGYAGGGGDQIGEAAPSGDGIWRTPVVGGEPELILSLEDARRFLMSRLSLKERLGHGVRRYRYWFNHLKLSPSGRRLTVKLRWRRLGGPWNEAQGVSLTASTEGGDLRLLADATSHVIWLNEEELYLWRRGEVALFADGSPEGQRVRALAPDHLDRNVHIRHLPPGHRDNMETAVFDTPYREEVALRILDLEKGEASEIGRFSNHTPPRGPFRCDLHPCPSRDGRKIVVTTLQDGGRQVHLFERRS